MIYTNPNAEVLSENAQILTEGFTINKNPPKEFYRTALNITNGIIDIIGNLNIRRTIYNGKNFKNGTAKMKYNTSFTKSADRARDSIKSREIGKMPLANMNSRFSISLYIGSLGWDYSPSYVAQEVSKPIIKSGFYIMNESKNFLKSMFQNIYLYKPLSDKSLMVVKFSVSYVTQYGAFAGWTNISIHFKAVANDEKSLRALNIIEAGNMEQLSEGIFDRFKKSKIDNKKPVSNKPEPKHKPEAKVQIKKNDFTNEQFEEIYDKSDAILEKHWNGMISEIKKIISKTYVSSAYKLYPYEGCEYMRTDIWGGVGFEFPCVFTSPIGIDITNVEPNARTDYDTSPAIKAVNETNKNIIECIKKYFKKYDITLYAIETGDWDTYNIDIFIPIKNLELSFQIPTLEFAIFESVEFI